MHWHSFLATLFPCSVGSCILGPVFSGHSYTGLQCAVNMQTPWQVYNLRVMSNLDRVSLLLTSCLGSLMNAGKNRPGVVQSQDPHAVANEQCEMPKNDSFGLKLQRFVLKAVSYIPTKVIADYQRNKTFILSYKYSQPLEPIHGCYNEYIRWKTSKVLRCSWK